MIYNYGHGPTWQGVVKTAPSKCGSSVSPNVGNLDRLKPLSDNEDADFTNHCSIKDRLIIIQARKGYLIRLYPMKKIARAYRVLLLVLAPLHGVVILPCLSLGMIPRIYIADNCHQRH